MPTFPAVKNLPSLALPIALGLALYGTLVYLCRAVWFSEGSPLGYQCLIPMGTVVLAWSRRSEVRTVQRELATLFPNPTHPKRCGNEALLWIGGLVLLAGILAAFPPLGIFGFIVAGFGAIFYFFGPFVVRSLGLPLAFLFLMLFPPPIQAVYHVITRIFQLRSTAFAGYVLKAFGQKPHIQDSTLILPNHAPLSIPIEFNGLDILLSALAFTIFCIAYHRIRLGMSVLLAFFAIVTAMLINICRILVFCSFPNKEFLPTFPLQLFVFLMIWQMARRLVLMQPKEREM